MKKLLLLVVGLSCYPLFGSVQKLAEKVCASRALQARYLKNYKKYYPNIVQTYLGKPVVPEKALTLKVPVYVLHMPQSARLKIFVKYFNIAGLGIVPEKLPYFIFRFKNHLTQLEQRVQKIEFESCNSCHDIRVQMQAIYICKDLEHALRCCLVTRSFLDQVIMPKEYALLQEAIGELKLLCKKARQLTSCLVSPI